MGKQQSQVELLKRLGDHDTVSKKERSFSNVLSALTDLERSQYITLTYTDSTQGVAKELSVLMDQKLREQQQMVSFPCDIRFVGLESGIPEWNLMIQNIY